MKYLVFILCLLVPLLDATAQTKQQLIQEDLINYINNHLITASPIEDLVIKTWGGVTGSNYKDDATMYRDLTTIILPQYDQFIKLLKEAKPQTKEVQKLNNQYIKASEAQYKAFLSLTPILESQNASKIPVFNANLTKAGNMVRQYNVDFSNALQKYEVELNYD